MLRSEWTAVELTKRLPKQLKDGLLILAQLADSAVGKQRPQFGFIVRLDRKLVGINRIPNLDILRTQRLADFIDQPRPRNLNYMAVRILKRRSDASVYNTGMTG
jgi:hypothetical protein